MHTDRVTDRQTDRQIDDMCIYIYIYIYSAEAYLSLSMNRFTDLFLLTHVCMYGRTCMYVCVYIYIYIYLFIYLFIDLSIYFVLCRYTLFVSAQDIIVCGICSCTYHVAGDVDATYLHISTCQLVQ